MKHHLIRACYAGDVDFRKRIPELTELADKRALVVGLGSIGAPLAVELARAGIGALQLVDFDDVDAGNACRWPFGLSAAGQPKPLWLADWLTCDYPWTESKGHMFKFGEVQMDGVRSNKESDFDFLANFGADIDLLVDASAEVGVQHLLSDWAWTAGKTYMTVTGTSGGWGGDIIRVRAQSGNGCWHCVLAAAQQLGFPKPPAKDELGVQPAGCGNPTFTGAGVDMLQLAILGARVAISTLCNGKDGAYPPIEHDVHVVSLRGSNGEFVMPQVESLTVTKNEECQWCGANLQAKSG